MGRRWKLFGAVVTLALLFDQLTKLWARGALSEDGGPVPLIKGFWYWELSYNTGAAFSFLRGQDGGRILLSIVGVLACGVLLWMVRRGNDTQRWYPTGLGLVFGGAVGNLIDRIGFGKVTDFVLWKIGEHRWPVFNVADCVLVAGVIILFLDIGKDQKRAREEKDRARAAAA
jgi:signal peptidase II